VKIDDVSVTISVRENNPGDNAPSATAATGSNPAYCVFTLMRAGVDIMFLGSASNPGQHEWPATGIRVVKADAYARIHYCSAESGCYAGMY